MVDSRRELRSELTRRINPIVTALSSLECAIIVQQDQLYNSVVKGASINSIYNAIMHYTILYYTIRYYTILYYTILYYTILYYTIL